ncbi:hypothetical protein ACJX0J_013522 [Zea mays]
MNMFLVSTEWEEKPEGSYSMDGWHGSLSKFIIWKKPFDEEEIKQAIDLMHSFLIGFPRNILEGVVILHEKAYDKVFFHYKMNSIRSNFFWQGAEKKKCYHMVWDEFLTHGRDESMYKKDIAPWHILSLEGTIFLARHGLGLMAESSHAVEEVQALMEEEYWKINCFPQAGGTTLLEEMFLLEGLMKSLSAGLSVINIQTDKTPYLFSIG